MLSMTDMDAPQITLATPEDVKAASEKALNFWVGAMSPMWLPFWAASTVGVSVWALAQGFKRNGVAPLDLGRDAPLVAKWPGYSLPFATPWSKGWGQAAIELDEAVELVKEAVAEPMQLTLEAEEKIEAALFPVAETAQSTTTAGVETATEQVAEVATPVVETVAEAIKPVTEPIVKKAKKIAEAPLIDPVTETPVIPSVAEATAEIIPAEALMPAPRKSTIPPLAPIPRRPDSKSAKPKKR